MRIYLDSPESGFTFIELMVVGAIISILALGGASLFYYQTQQNLYIRGLVQRNALRMEIDRYLNDITVLQRSVHLPGNDNFKSCVIGGGTCTAVQNQDVTIVDPTDSSNTAILSTGFTNPQGYTLEGGRCNLPSANCFFLVSTRYTSICPGGTPSCTSTADRVVIDYQIQIRNNGGSFSGLKGQPITSIAQTIRPTVAQRLQVYDTPGNYTYVVPSGVNLVTTEAWGGGGGGIGCGNMGGGAGGYGKTMFNVIPGQSIPVSVGAPGPPGGCGGTSTFGSGATILSSSGGCGPNPGSSNGTVNVNGGWGQNGIGGGAGGAAGGGGGAGGPLASGSNCYYSGSSPGGGGASGGSGGAGRVIVYW